MMSSVHLNEMKLKKSLCKFKLKNGLKIALFCFFSRFCNKRQSDLAKFLEELCKSDEWHIDEKKT
jgi:hypothetical protein